jgi:hypothetical protein
MAMPQLSKQLEKRLSDLIANPPHAISYQGLKNEASRAEAHGWSVSAASVIASVVSNISHPYRTAVTMYLAILHNDPVQAASSLLGLLTQLKADFEAGVLSNLEAQISAQTFDDLLDHAEAYLAERRPEPAGVLAGVIFEDTVRKLCGRHNIPEAGAKLDNLLSELVKVSAITPLERKECTAAAALRTSATHARWEEFDTGQVQTVINLTRKLIREKLAA